MNILVLVTGAFGDVGGIAKFNRDLLLAIESHSSVQHITCLPRFIRTAHDPLNEKWDHRTRAAKGLRSYALEVLRCLTADIHYDLIICGHINLLPFAEICRRQFHCPLWMTMHGYEAWTPPTLLRGKLVDFVDTFCSVSEFTWNRFAPWSGQGHRAHFLLPNTIDLNRFYPLPKSTALAKEYQLEGKRVLLTVGRIDASERWKGFDQIIEILPRLLQRDPRWKYLIVGDGSDRERLQEKTRSLGIANHVTFTGYVDENKKSEIYRLAHIYAMPSQAEGFGIVFLEALASGLTVIGSHTDSAQEVLRNGDWGYLVNPHDLDAIEKTIEQAFQKPIHVSKELLEEYSPAQFERRCHSLLDKLFSEKKH